MSNNTPLNFEIFSVVGLSASDLYLLLHINEEPDDWETYRAAVVRLTPDTEEVVYAVNAWLTSLAQSPSGNLYATSAKGDIHSCTDGQWQVISLGRRYSLNRIACLPDGSLVCCGSSAGVFQQNDTDWHLINDGLPVDCDLIAVGGLNTHYLYALGDRGIIFHWNGRQWSDVASPTNETLVNMLALSEQEVYFCGWHGAMFLKRGLSWTQFTGTDSYLYSLASYDGRILVGAASDGSLAIDGSTLTPFNEHVTATGLRVIGDRLIAFGESTIHTFDGQTWTRRDLDFSKLIT